MVQNPDKPVLAIYDFRSKQEYIYRTNRMREITGASELIAGMYARFIQKEVSGDAAYAVEGGHLWKDWDGRDCNNKKITESPRPLFDTNGSINLGYGEMGIVVYEGGGNLLVLYKNQDEYMNANRAFSKLVIDEAYSLNMVTAYAKWPKGMGVEAFKDVRREVMRNLDYAKRVGVVGVPANALPYTLVDRATFQPITKKEAVSKDEVLELSHESERKYEAFKRVIQQKEKDDANFATDWEEQGKYLDELGTQKGEDSLIAVLYFDGNSIGDRVKHLLDEVEDPSQYVEEMRKFSKGLHKLLVADTESAIKDAIGRRQQDSEDDEANKKDDPIPGQLQRKQRGYRVVIDHGDEITLVCNAHAAALALDAYFKAIAQSEYKACAGVAFCHAHDPFYEVYRIAKQCCESGKKANRKEMAFAIQRAFDETHDDEDMRKAAESQNSSYVDFHFVRSGITGSLEQIRNEQEGSYTARPYKIGESYDQFLAVGHALASGMLQRQDIKALNRAILRGESWYQLEYARMRAKDPKTMNSVEQVVEEVGLRKRILFDVCSMWDVFDVCFYA